MSSPALPALPNKLKAIQHYIKTAVEHDKRDPIIAYYCRLYAMQRGMEIDRKSPECKQYLVALMGHLEQFKKESSEEAVLNEVVGQAHVENYALKVFLFADNEDRAARFTKNVVKSFYTAGMLFDTLTVFGEISEDIEKNRKYAKWKAAYIHKCLKNGETPIAGPMADEEDEGLGGFGGGGPVGFEQTGAGPSTSYQPGPSTYQPSLLSSDITPQSSDYNLPTPTNQFPSVPQSGAHAPPTTPQDLPQATKPSPSATYTTDWTPPTNSNGVQLSSLQYQKAMKYCKFASSALQYEDSQTAIDNLSKALKLLTTGKDS